MKHVSLACALGLAIGGLAANAALAAQSARNDCRDEATSTGLENEDDIQAYVYQCMQRFAGLDGYEEVSTDETAESPLMDRRDDYETTN